MSQSRNNGIACIFSRHNWAACGDRRWLAASNLTLAALAIGLFCGYLWYNNQTAAYGFAIRDLESQIEQLQDKKRSLDLEVLSRRSMENIESHVQEMGFIPVSGVEYMVVGGSGMALK